MQKPRSREKAPSGIIEQIVVKIIQIRISEPLKPAARPNSHIQTTQTRRQAKFAYPNLIQTLSKPYPNHIHIILGIAYVISRHQPQEKRAQNRCPHARVVPRKNVVRTRALFHAKMLPARARCAIIKIGGLRTPAAHKDNRLEMKIC